MNSHSKVPVSEQQIFEQLLALNGKDVEVGLQEGGIVLGRIINTMFDSFMLQTKAGNKIVRFEDLSFLRRTATE